ncbi:pentatricopeptide repeat-containing protein At4g39530 [Amborella trichopoda]|nr:pentatricopeptide repeat-containing protein At4g39530 [Amborella trichopoda]|eukprot:XP_006833341.2 pentatricopeptide repeat-containing protein At4g39530 [Amborella trichopoda]
MQRLCATHFCPTLHHILKPHEARTPSYYASLLQLCLQSESMEKGKQIHASILTSGFMENLFLANSLTNFYAKFGDMENAHKVFDTVRVRNVVSWTSMISGYSRLGLYESGLEVFREMVKAGERPNQFTFSLTMQACTTVLSLDIGVQIHGLIIKCGLDQEDFTGSSLLDMYSKLGLLNSAFLVFKNLFHRDSVSWNSMIAGCAKNGDYMEAFRLFYEMQIEGIKPNDFTFSGLLKSCKSEKEVEQIHSSILKCGVERDNVLGSVLVDVYAKCGSLGSGRKILDSMARKDRFAWSSAISGYAKSGEGEEALVFFREMCREAMKPDQHALSSALKACAETSGLLEQGKQLHAQVVKMGYQTENFVASVLLSLYANSSLLSDSEKVFRGIKERDRVSWNSMMVVFAERKETALGTINLYCKFQQMGFSPDVFTFIAVLKACSNMSDSSMGFQIHTHIIKSNWGSDISIGNAVIEMYANCTSIDEARRAFDNMSCRDEISWSSIIASYAQEDDGFEALLLCKQMQIEGFRLTEFSLAPCLMACAILAAMELGRQLHATITKSGFSSQVYVGSSILDMYAKCGSIEDSIVAFHEVQAPNIVTFNALISGYAQNGRAQEAINIFNELPKLGIAPNSVTFIGVLNACSHVGLVRASLNYFNSMSLDYGISPEFQHYSCLVDVLGRAGELEKAHEIVTKIPFPEAIPAYRTLLAACRNFGELEIGQKIAKKVLEWDPHDHSAYVLLCNIYSATGRWEEAFRMRREMGAMGVKKEPGGSWVIIRGRVHGFFVGDFTHPEMEEILGELNWLHLQMKAADNLFGLDQI